MGRIIAHATDATAVSRVRGGLSGTQRVTSTQVPGDLPRSAILRAMSDNFPRNIELAFTIDPTVATNTLTLTSGQIRLTAIYIPTSIVVAGVGIGVDTLPSGSSNGFNGWAIYSWDNGDHVGLGPNLNLVTYRAGSSLTDAFGGTGNSYYSSFLTTPATIGRGLYYVGIGVNTTGTGPQVAVNTIKGYLHQMSAPMPQVATFNSSSSTPPTTIAQSSLSGAADMAFSSIIGSTG